jgi:hypothetical protein
MLRKNETAARHVHAVLAAAVDNPILLERLRRQPANRRKDGAAAFDLERIRLFAGLAVKVRQNDVRLRLPLTFKLLDRLKISVVLFAAYGKQAAALRQAKRKTLADKMESISRFMEDWLDAGDPRHALVRDMLHHERALLVLNDHRGTGSARDHAETIARAATVRPKSVPRPVAGLIRHEMSCDPLALERLLRSPDSDLSKLRRGQFHYVYSRDKERGCISAKEIDELGHVLVSLADGRRSAARLVEVLRRAGVVLTHDQLCDAVQDLVDNGILILRA